ncbi:hypothetical protein DUNSADRAFT_17227 [Dunaliella salina]|uniref:Uncharacterized protein n=1 Tax=Dunaliella salina TaxID=3046 RepID=A0ABQ7G250_DUNSA|nr:hypothetical protein DUNSADRAFT_17227 [Dunaliella salina]|eukprot:KAF5828679.1 hypothetical protein DUNSADRAFT_17227 [Dunaliella salina]
MNHSLAGAALAPTNYKALAIATSQAAAAKYGAAGLRCWVAIAGVDLIQLLPLLGELEALEQPNAPPGTVPLPTAEMLGPMVMREVSKQAAEQGFDDRSSRSGRLTNVLVATHSASGLYFGDAAVKHAGGLAMLGSTWSSEVLGKLAIAGGWLAGSRPMMMLTGELDGQMGWPHIMPYAAQAAWWPSTRLLQSGRMLPMQANERLHVKTWKLLILLLELICGTAGLMQVAIDQAAAKWEDAWEGPQLPADPSAPSSISAFDYMVPPPFGGRAEVHVQCFQHFPALDRPSSSPSGLYPASPDLWLKLKSGIGLAIELRHELGLPTLASEEGAEEKQGKMGKPVDMPEGSPAAAAAKGMKGVSKMVIAGTEEGAVSAADVNRAAMEWALQAAPEDVRQRYLTRGVPLEFGEDQVVESPPSWVKNSRISYEVQTGPPPASSSPSDAAATSGSTEPQEQAQANGSTAPGGSSNEAPPSGSSSSEQQQHEPRSLLVRSPVLRGIVADDVSQLGLEDRRFLGSLYIKVMSRAMALEWVSIGGVRQATQGTRCLWGGH